jgi:hypothetical protein
METAENLTLNANRAAGLSDLYLKKEALSRRIYTVIHVVKPIFTNNSIMARAKILKG